MTPNWTPRRDADDAEGPLPHHDRLHAEGRHARPRHDVPHLHGADQSRLLLRSRHGQEAARRRSRCSRSRPRCSPIRRSPKASPTAFSRSARRSGATPIRDRSGMLPWAFEPGMGFERYVDYALDVPMYFVKRGDRYIDVAGQSFRDLHAGQAARRCPASARPSPTGPITSRRSFRRCGSSAISKCAAPTAGRGGGCRRCRPTGSGLLYDDAALDAAWDLVKDWSAQDARHCATTCRASASRRRAGRACSISQGDARAAEAGLAAGAGSTPTATTRRAICGRCRNSSRAASRRPRSCWRNSTALGRLGRPGVPEYAY